MQFQSDTEKAVSGIKDAVDTYTALQQNQRANREAKQREEQQAAHLAYLGLQGDLARRESQRQDDENARAQQDQVWKVQRRAQDDAEDAAFREAQGRLWSSAFGEDPPDDVIGPMPDGATRGVPRDVDSIFRTVAPAAAKLGPERGRQLLDTARTLGGVLVRSRHVAQTKALIDQIAQRTGPDGQPAVDENGAPVGILPAEQAQKLREALDKGVPDENGVLQPVDPDTVDHLVHSVIREDAKGKAALQVRAGALQRIDGVAQTIQSGQLGPVQNPMAFEEALAMRHQLEALPLSGDALAAAERRVNEKFFSALSPKSGSGSSGTKAQRLDWTTKPHEDYDEHDWYDRAVSLVKDSGIKFDSPEQWGAAVDRLMPPDARAKIRARDAAAGGPANDGGGRVPLPIGPGAGGAQGAAPAPAPAPVQLGDEKQIRSDAADPEWRASNAQALAKYAKQQGWSKDEFTSFVQSGEWPRGGGDEEANEKAGAPDEPEQRDILPERSRPLPIKRNRSRDTRYGETIDTEETVPASREPEDMLLKAAANYSEGRYQAVLAEYRRKVGEPDADLRRRIRAARASQVEQRKALERNADKR